MKKLRRGWTAAALLAPLLLLLLVDLQPRAGETPPRLQAWQQSGPISVGFARVPLAPPPGTPLGGYAARRGAAADTLLEGVGVSAMVLQAGEQCAAFTAVDIVLVPESLRAAVGARTAAQALWVSATHNHAGPGGYWDNLLAQFAGMGDYSEVWAEALADSIARAVNLAQQRVQPATFWHGMAGEHGLAQPRANQQSPRTVPLQILEARDPAGRPLGGLVVHAAHPTILGKRSLRLSAEWPGQCARTLADSLGGLWLVLQGPSGDLKPSLIRPAKNEIDRMRDYGRAVAGLVRATERRPLFPERLRAGWIEQQPLPADATGLVAGPLKTLVSNGLAPFTRAPLRVDVVALGPLLLVGVGAEPVRAAGASLAAAVAGAQPEGQPIVVGLTNGYLGYVEMAERVRLRQGEAERVYFGSALEAELNGLGALLAERLEELGDKPE